MGGLFPPSSECLIELDDAERLAQLDPRQSQLRLKLIPIGVEGI